MNNQQIKHIIKAIIVSSIIMAIVVAGYYFAPAHGIKRVCEMFGGNLPFGLIQYISYITFFWAWFEISERLSLVNYEEQALTMQLLPEQEHWVITPDDVNDLKIRMIEMEKTNKYQVISVIKRACTKFRANNSVPEVMETVENQVKTIASEAETHQSNVRFLAWLIPSIGFIGTVIGIGQSLGMAEKASDPEVMGEITNAMEVAFDTTLVALVLSIPIMWYYHRLQETEERFYLKLKDYVMENLVN